MKIRIRKKIFAGLLSVLMLFNSLLPGMANVMAAGDGLQDIQSQEMQETQGAASGKREPVQLSHDVEFYHPETGAVTTSSLEFLIVDGEDVYVDGAEFSRQMGFDRVSYSADAFCAIERLEYSLPGGNRTFYKDLLVFETDAKKAKKRCLAQTVLEYTVPFPTRYDAEQDIYWLPFEFTAYLMDGCYGIFGSTLQVQTPSRTAMDSMTDLFNFGTDLSFDWERDLGHSVSDLMVKGAGYHGINFISGIMSLDRSAWSNHFLAIASGGRKNSYNMKYGEDLTQLLMQTSAAEYQVIEKQAKTAELLFSTENSFAEMLTTVNLDLAASRQNYITALDNWIEEVTVTAMSCNPPTAAKVIRLGNLRAKQKDCLKHLNIESKVFSGIGTGLKLASHVLKIARAVDDFNGQDRFAVEAMDRTLSGMKKEQGRLIPDDMLDSMSKKLRLFQTNAAEYSLTEFFRNNTLEIAWDRADVLKTLGDKASVASLIWGLYAGLDPLDVLGTADSFELALYAFVFQADCRVRFHESMDLLTNPDQLTEQNLKNAAMDAYIYLKTANAARDAAIASLKTCYDVNTIRKAVGSEGGQQYVEALDRIYEDQNQVNLLINDLLEPLLPAGSEDAFRPYGFLPEEAEEYRDVRDEELLVLYLLAEVQNNGGSFVGYKNHLYYWRYGDGSLSRNGLMGYFNVDNYAPNVLIDRNLADDTETVIAKGGAGGLYIAGERIYFASGIQSVVSVNLMGEDPRYYEKHTIVGVAESKLIARNVNGGERLTAINSDGSEWELVRGECTYLGQDGGRVYYSQFSRSDSMMHVTVSSVLLNGNAPKQLGSFQTPVDRMSGLRQEGMIVGPWLYITSLTIGGTGMFYWDGLVARFKTDGSGEGGILVPVGSGYAPRYPMMETGVEGDEPHRYIYYAGAKTGETSSLLDLNYQPYVTEEILKMDTLDGSVSPSEEFGRFVSTKPGYVLLNGVIAGRRDDSGPYEEIFSFNMVQQTGNFELNNYQAGEIKQISDFSIVGDYAFLTISTIGQNGQNLGWRVGYERTLSEVFQTKIGSGKVEKLYEFR